MILDERHVKVSHPIPISGTGDELSSSYQIKVSLEALIAIQMGEPDTGFEVSLESNRESYAENEPVFLTITSTRSGFLTIFSIENDSLTLLFPNNLSRNNTIKADAPIYFPPTTAYKLTLQTLPNQKKSYITFVAVVSKDKVLFSSIEETKFEGNYIKLKQAMLTHYAKWLYKIPIDRRSSDAKILTIFKKKN
ncbi:MAG: DUF4384 domain-containing protein [Bacteroidota bacterium]|nr:DUF4384 domain-containing protein [Bacteroidota bacterium]